MRKNSDGTAVPMKIASALFSAYCRRPAPMMEIDPDGLAEAKQVAGSA